MNHDEFAFNDSMRAHTRVIALKLQYFPVVKAGLSTTLHSLGTVAGRHPSRKTTKQQAPCGRPFPNKTNRTETLLPDNLKLIC